MNMLIKTDSEGEQGEATKTYLFEFGQITYIPTTISY